MAHGFDIEQRFPINYSAPKISPDDGETAATFQAAIYSVAKYIEENIPQNFYQSNAFTHLEQVLFYAHKALELDAFEKAAEASDEK